MIPAHHVKWICYATVCWLSAAIFGIAVLVAIMYHLFKWFV